MAEHDQAEDYSPEKIEQYLRHWRELLAGAEGGTGSNGRGAGRGDRLALVALVADLEQAADALPLEWSATRVVFWYQQRAQEWSSRRPTPGRFMLEDVPVERALEAMARYLGWLQSSPGPASESRG